MKILFEGYRYKSQMLSECLDSRYYSPASDPVFSVVNYVGYYFNPMAGDAVMILPKVFIYSNGKAFGKYMPEDIVCCRDEDREKLRKMPAGKILFHLSTWLYQAILQFHRKHSTTMIVRTELASNVVSSLGDNSVTELDIVLSLLRFYRENQQLFTYISRLRHSGQGKIHWGKTVARCAPCMIEGKIPVYMEVMAGRKHIDYDEELIVIFYSVLNYLSCSYGFPIAFNQKYSLLAGCGFRRLMEQGTRRLKAIRGKYFTDRMIRLWNLLYAFFERVESVKSSVKVREEVLLAKDFNIIFEDMIDELVGDRDIPDYLKAHKDGKQLDHIFLYRSLIEKDDIYYIGDSKYYKPDSKVGEASIAKQYTYAKNVIQYSIDLFHKGMLKDNIRYRDDLTEGYNISPNFFISAFVDNDLDFSKDGLTFAYDMHESNFHFKNRLFDRDTLFLQAYNINFLFVLSAYVKRSTRIACSFRRKVQGLFREKLVELFNGKFDFYMVTPKMPIDKFVSRHFKDMIGKMYRPADMKNRLIVALEKDAADNERVLGIIHNECEVEEYRLT